MTAISFTEEKLLDWSKGEKRADGSCYRVGLAPGLSRWSDGEPGRAMLSFVCPCGCGSVHRVNAFTDEAAAKAHGWHWNGNREKPTLKPSLQLHSDCKWHGFLTDGVFAKC